MPGEELAAITVVLEIRDRRGGLDLEGRTDGRKLGSATSVREKPVMTDAAEAFRQLMQEEAADELMSLERHDLELAASMIVLPAEADPAALTGEEPAVGNGDTLV
jgi:hypothetical protein